jgi:quinol monooxygenase YgiN
MSVIVVATARPLPGLRDEAVRKFEAAIAAVPKLDRGCELYALHTADDRLVMIEKWESRDSLKAHARGQVVADLNAALDGILVGRVDVQVLTPHPAGTAQQGVL